MDPSPERSLIRDDEGRRAGRILGWDRLLASVAEYAALGRAGDRIRRSEPVDDVEPLRERFRWVEEILRHLVRGDDVPLAPCEDLVAIVGDERTETGPLGGEDLAAVAGAARGLSELIHGVRAFGDRLTFTARALRGAEDPAPLAERLEAEIDPDGRLRDSASPRLGPLRRAAEAAGARVRDVARNAMQEAAAGGYTMSGELVMRGSRPCIPVRAGARRRVPGIVHDRSGTGGTVFVEPMAVVEAGNELAECRIAVEDEERRILVELNRAVADRVPALLDLFERAVEIDTVRARARWGHAHEAEIPQLERSPRAPVRIEGFRHPLLQRSLAEAGRPEDLVPLDLRLDDARLILVSGPNAGGKTVTLKSVGLAALMAQAAIPLPCAHPPRLPVFDHVLVDTGDEQSIDDALSSFSAHLTHLRAILATATERSLVLLDEIGGGTDPEEGVVLARAILEHLVRGGGRAFVTTHYGQLKALVEEDPAFRHASMAFDQERLRPLFELRLDVPGASHALEIAERMAMPDDVLGRARELLGDERVRLDELLRSMDAARAEAEATRAELTEQLDRSRLSQQHYDRLARELKQSRKERLDQAEREAEGIVRNARRRVERLLQQIREAGGSEEAVEAARAARDEIEERSEHLRQRQEKRRRPASGPRRAPRIEEGALVRHTDLGSVGRIVEVRGDRVRLEIGGARVVARVDQLAAPDDEQARVETAPSEGTIRTQLSDASPLAATQVDVRGYDVEDAWRLVDRAVDRCLVTGMRELEVVHGKGTGRLRAVIGQRLREDPRIRRSQLGGGGRHDDGVTVVEL